VVKNDKLFEVTTAFIKSISSKFQKSQYLQFIIDTIQDFTTCYAVGIRLLNVEGHMPCKVYTGFSDEFWRSENLLNINCDQGVDYGYKSLAALPIVYEHQTIGILHLADERPNLLTDEILEVLETLVPLIGEAMRRYCIEDELKRYHDNRMLIDALLNDVNVRAYVSDLESYEILYATKVLKESCGKEIVGGKCYQELYELSEP
jgi:hypothetical protein